MFTLNGTLVLMLPWSHNRIPKLAQEVAAPQKDPVPWVCGVAVNYYKGLGIRFHPPRILIETAYTSPVLTGSMC
jgi:hypothetical protein